MARSHRRQGPALALGEVLLACLRAAREAAGLGPGAADNAVHRVRRAMKRIHATVTLVPKPRADWLEAVRREARALHRQLGAQRDRFVVERTWAKLLARHPRRWGALDGVVVRRAADPGASDEPDWWEIERRLTELEARVGACPRAPAFDLAEALRRSYRKARRARSAAMASPKCGRVHVWRKALARLQAQLELNDRWLPRRARRLGCVLEKPTRQLGRCGDLSMLRRALARCRFADAQTLAARDDLLAWIERRSGKLLEKALAATEGALARRPRAIAKRLLRRDQPAR